MCAHTKKRRSRGRREWTLLERKGALLYAYGVKGGEGGVKKDGGGIALDSICVCLVWTCPGDQRRSSRIAADCYRCIYASDYASVSRRSPPLPSRPLSPREPPAWRHHRHRHHHRCHHHRRRNVLLPGEVCTRSRFVFLFVIVVRHCGIYRVSPPGRDSRVLVVAKDFRKFRLSPCSAKIECLFNAK